MLRPCGFSIATLCLIMSCGICIIERSIEELRDHTLGHWMASSSQLPWVISDFMIPLTSSCRHRIPSSVSGQWLFGDAYILSRETAPHEDYSKDPWRNTALSSTLLCFCVPCLRDSGEKRRRSVEAISSRYCALARLDRFRSTCSVRGLLRFEVRISEQYQALVDYSLHPGHIVAIVYRDAYGQQGLSFETGNDSQLSYFHHNGGYSHRRHSRQVLEDHNLIQVLENSAYSVDCCLLCPSRSTPTGEDRYARHLIRIAR